MSAKQESVMFCRGFPLSARRESGKTIEILYQVISGSGSVDVFVWI